MAARARLDGEGTIRRRADGRYEARYRVGLRRCSMYARSETELRAKLTRELADRDAGRLPPTRDMKTGAWLTRWVESHPLRPRSRELYRLMVRRFLVPELGHVRLADLRPVHISEALERIGRTPSMRGRKTVGPATVATAQRVLGAALEAALDNDLIGANPARRVRVVRHEREIVPPTPAEIERLLAELAGDELHALFLLLRWTGCRLGEARALRWADLDLRGSLVTFARQVDGPLKERASRRTLPLAPVARDAIARLPRRSLVYVFTTSTGQPFDNRRIQRVMERACLRAGVAPAVGDKAHYSPHDLRHAFAAELLEAGYSDSFVMSLLGHAQVATTVGVYGHIRPRRGGRRSQLAAWWDPLAPALTAADSGRAE